MIDELYQITLQRHIILTDQQTISYLKKILKHRTAEEKKSNKIHLGQIEIEKFSLVKSSIHYKQNGDGKC